MKNLAKLNGVKALSENEQKSINGGSGCPAKVHCWHHGRHYVCHQGTCSSFGGCHYC